MPVPGMTEFLEMTPEVHDAMCALALAEYPLEACGLLAGERSVRGDRIIRFFPCRNTEQSARVYTLDPKDHLRAERAAEDAGLEILGVMHSHTHTEAYPSPTDVAAAPDPGWHYVIVTLKREKPEARTYRITGTAGASGTTATSGAGQITEVRLDIRPDVRP